MTIRAIALASGLALLLLAAPARAQDDDDAPHILASMDRAGDDSRIGLDAAYTRFSDDEFFPGLRALRFDLYGRYVHPSGGGFAVAMPFTRVWNDDESEGAIGNLSLSALYNAGRGPVRVFTRAGLVLPTADDEDGGYNLYGGLGRLGDFATGLPETTTLQLAVSPQFSRGRGFVRADLGVDVMVDQPDEQDIGPLVHASVAAGVDTGAVDLAAELVNEFNIGDDEVDDEVLHTAGLSACYTGGRVQPHLGVVLPFGSDFDEVVDFVVLAGVSAAIQ
jgi:hypothetical protein